MARTVAIGHQDFKTIRANNYFYIDKTDFIKEWWENGDSVTLITRPRRFGKTLNMSMLEHFFSIQSTEQPSLFEGLSIWQDDAYRRLSGSYPVISLSFADIKETSYKQAREKYVSLSPTSITVFISLKPNFLSQIMTDSSFIRFPTRWITHWLRCL